MSFFGETVRQAKGKRMNKEQADTKLNGISPHILHEISTKYGISYKDLSIAAGHLIPVPSKSIDKVMEELAREFPDNLKVEEGVETFTCYDPRSIKDFLRQSIEFIQTGRFEDIFNLKELHMEWEDSFYESGWEYDTLNITESEKEIIGNLTSFLPRHMNVYDRSLPYAEKILLIIRRLLATKTPESLKDISKQGKEKE